jgi:hypothetical protein
VKYFKLSADQGNAKLNAAVDCATLRVLAFQQTLLKQQNHSGLLQGAVYRMPIITAESACSRGLEVVLILKGLKKSPN